MDLIKLSKKNVCNYTFEIPNIQRIHDPQKVQEIYDYQTFHYKRKSRFNFLGSIIINTIDSKTFYIIDGQHRYLTFKRLIDNGFDTIELCAQITKIETMEELRDNYNMINKNTPLPQFPENTDKNLVENVYSYFYTKFPKMFKDTLRVNRPYVNKVMFQEAIAYMANNLEMNEYGYLTKVIDEHNDIVGSWNKENMPRSKTITDNMLEICKENGFYLGLYTGKLNEYCYDWVKEIAKSKKNITIKTKRSNDGEYKKAKIPPVKRTRVWEKHIGNKARDKCWCCREVEICMTSFDCGHIIAEANGGTLDVDNLRPICKSCNCSMGTMNMKEYMRIHYPQNLSYMDKLLGGWSIFK